jgi:hypothetical protein
MLAGDVEAGRQHAAPATVRRRGEPRGQRTAGPALTPALLRPADALALQQRAGNRAVLRTLSGGRVRRLQRQETGLKESAATKTFATAGLAFWKDAANKDKPLSDYATHLMAKANAALKALGSFEVKSDFSGTGAASAGFDRGGWSIAINTGLFSSRSAITKVGQLTLDEAAEIADTIWHEMRHSEQYFRIARMRAALSSTKKTAAEIAKELKDGMSIPADVALAAAGAPLKAVKGNEKLLAEAKDWESITLGFHSTYKENITAWVLENRSALDVANGVTDKNLATTRGGLAAFVTSWTNDADRGKFVASHTTATEAIATKSPLDKLVLKHLKEIKPALAKVQAAWKDVEDNWAKDTDAQKLARLRAMQSPLNDFDTALYAAYRDHLHEKDAWETGVAVGKEFRKQGATK